MRNALTIRKAFVVIIALVLLGNTQHVFGQSGWQTRTTDHFEIYYERSLADQVDRVVTEAERAYGRISADLRHSLPTRMPLIMLNSRRELPDSEQGALNIIRRSGAPLTGDHLMLPVEPADQREATLTHELTHQFEFELIPQSPQLPSWVYEGLAEYERGRWTSSGPSTMPASGVVPALSRLTGSDRNWGRAVFDFIGDEFGTQGIRRYLMVLRDVGTSGDAIQEAFGLSSNQFDQEFARYVKAR